MTGTRPLRRRLVRTAATGVAVLFVALLIERVVAACWPYPFAALTAIESSREVLAQDGTVLRVASTARGERRLPVALAEVSPHLLHALIAAEDQRFFEHGGVDPWALARAASSNLAAGRVVSGASTLTMQLVRIVEPRPRTLCSKVVELFRARELERAWSKERILEAYVNLVPLGGTLRGFEAAARRWFGKRAASLAPDEAATLVAMLPAPSRLARDGARAELRERRDRVLVRMQELRFLTDAQLAGALRQLLRARAHPWPFEAPHFCDWVLARTLESPIRTALDRPLQLRIESVVAAGEAAGADGVAAIVLRRGDAEVRALVGGRDRHASRVNGALARRDAGSTLKPFLYALGIASGATGLDERLDDAPITLHGWSPQNFDGRFAGRVRSADALTQSRNVPAVLLLEQVGTMRFRELLRELSLDCGARPLDLSAALGTVAVSPLELARAYVRFADDPRNRRILDTLAGQAPLPGLSPEHRISWKTGTSSGRRDAWCIAVAEENVVCVWLGDLAARGSPDLVGLRAAAPLCARIIESL